MPNHLGLMTFYCQYNYSRALEIAIFGACALRKSSTREALKLPHKFDSVPNGTAIHLQGV